MTLFRCPVCDQRPHSKPVTVFWAWRDVEQERHSYRQQLCTSCYTDQLATFAAAAFAEGTLTCPQCGIDTETDYDAIYANMFIPSYGRLDVEAPTCGPCATKLRVWVHDHAVQLEDRGRADVSPSPRPSGDDVLRAMGILPRVR